jgi:hypothetical protein
MHLCIFPSHPFMPLFVGILSVSILPFLAVSGSASFVSFSSLPHLFKQFSSVSLSLSFSLSHSLSLILSLILSLSHSLSLILSLSLTFLYLGSFF